MHLTAIRHAPQPLWTILVEAMIEGEWSKEETKAQVTAINEILALRPDWWSLDWYVCIPCNIRWWGGDNVFSNWRTETPDKWQDNAKILEQFAEWESPNLN